MSGRAIAMFVDFDNIFLTIQNESRAAAESFGRRPGPWLDWFAKGAYRSAAGEDEADGRMLVRRCYINPGPFGRFRVNFTSAGFQSIDCPSLTGMGKNSADIIMALDIVDLLHHPTRFDEFIILSGDADFTPVLLKLREHDRETTVLANQLASDALKSAATNVVDIEQFIEAAVDVRPMPKPPEQAAAGEGPRIADRDAELDTVAGIVAAEIEKAGSLPLDRLAQVILASYPPFKQSGWLGYGTLRGMVTALQGVDPRLAIKETMDGDAFILDMTVEIEELSEEAMSSRREQVLEMVRERVAASDAPVYGAALGAEILGAFGQGIKRSSWLGAGSLSQLVASADLSGVAVETRSDGTLFYDPNRHTLTPAETQARPDNLDGVAPGLADFIDRVSGVGWPRLNAEQHGLIARIAAEGIAEGLTERSPLSAYVRDRIAAKIASGEVAERNQVSRAPIGFILNGLFLGGALFGDNCSTEAEIRVRMRDSLERYVTNRIEPPSEEDLAHINDLTMDAGEALAEPLAPAEPVAAEDQAAPLAEAPLPADNAVEAQPRFAPLPEEAQSAPPAAEPTTADDTEPPLAAEETPATTGYFPQPDPFISSAPQGFAEPLNEFTGEVDQTSTQQPDESEEPPR